MYMVYLIRCWGVYGTISIQRCLRITMMWYSMSKSVILSTVGADAKIVARIYCRIVFTCVVYPLP